MCYFSSTFPLKWKEDPITSYYISIFLQYIFVVGGPHEMTDLGNICSLWLWCKQENSLLWYLFTAYSRICFCFHLFALRISWIIGMCLSIKQCAQTQTKLTDTSDVLYSFSCIFLYVWPSTNLSPSLNLFLIPAVVWGFMEISNSLCSPPNPQKPRVPVAYCRDNLSQTAVDFTMCLSLYIHSWLTYLHLRSRAFQICL